MKYTVPEYYKTFSCKGGDCRHTCCHGWGITLSMDEYYKILGMDCDPLLRRRLDTAFYPVENPTKERFAAVNHRYDGDCPLHAEDGLCELHRQMGEGAIPSVCRMYPRSVRFGCCSCTNSCEATLEALLKCDKILGFTEAEYDYPYGREEAAPNAEALLSKAIATLSDASIPLKKRIMRVAHENGVELTSPELHYDKLFEMLSTLSEGSEALSEYFIPLLPYFGENGENVPTLIEKFETSFPEHETFFANILINHVFYDRFATDGSAAAAEKSSRALCVVYGIMRLAAAGTAELGSGVNTLIDTVAGVFRWIEHSSFDSTVCRYMAKLSISPEEWLAI